MALSCSLKGSLCLRVVPFPVVGGVLGPPFLWECAWQTPATVDVGGGVGSTRQHCVHR